MMHVGNRNTKKAMDPMTASPKRTFIGWSQPALQIATERLFEQHARDGRWDLRRWIIVLSSSLATRRLNELLALRAEQADCVLYPPEIVTVGHLPEYLYVAKFPFASDLVQVLAWCQALQQVDASGIGLDKHVPLPPKNGYPEQWLELGKMLASVHRELASDRQNFRSVATLLEQHPEAARWTTLTAVQDQYLRLLDGLKLWDVQTARIEALKRDEPKTDREILMLGAVDLNQTQRGFLHAVADHVHVWVAAPASMAEKFDEFGCLISDQWENETLDLPEECLLVGNSPADQFELTAACISQLGDNVHARDITLGMPDPTLIPLMDEHLRLSGAEVRFGPGTPLVQSEPAQLLKLIGGYLKNRNYSDFAALIRHPVVANMLSARLGSNDDWLNQVDAYYQLVLPRTVESWVRKFPIEPGKFDNNIYSDTYAAVRDELHEWLAGLMTPLQTLDAWALPLLEVLQLAFKNRAIDGTSVEGERLSMACRAVTDSIGQLRDIPASLAIKLSASEAISWLLHNMSGTLVPQPVSATAIEISGWLDLPLDDAPHLIIAGIHDGVVPESVNADPFLPNQVRRQLGMVDNARRYARDMYAFQSTLHTRKSVQVIVGRTSLSGDPLVPSRLLLACDLAKLPARVLRLISEDSVDTLPPVAKQWNSNADSGIQPLSIPAADSSKIPSRMTVTAFRTYMDCPYRYYLNHVLKLDNVSDSDAELSAGQFGDLIHATLDAMHDDKAEKTTDAQKLTDYLVRKVEELALDWYGPNPAAAIRVQIAQAQDRLATFAIKQVEYFADGWETKFHEETCRLLKGSEFLPGLNAPIELYGRIDRIDYHPGKDLWAIWDYKTSDAGKKPLANHFSKSQGWTDLQLPLYRHLLRTLNVSVTGDIQLGYILLPKTSTSIDFSIANFQPEQLAEADELAYQIMEKVSRGIYEPLTTSAIDYDDFARICQAGVQSSVPPKPKRLIKDNRIKAASNPTIDSKVIDQAAMRLNDPEDQTRRAAVAQSLKPLMIRASAGTGKTYQLSNRLLQIILSGQSVDHVLATTFTRKAAGEILQRVLVRLANACIDDEEFEKLKTAIPHLPFDRADCLVALRRVTRQLHRFRVSTLDSFYAQIARTFSLELRLAPGWSAIDPVLEANVRMQAIQRMLDESDQRVLTSLVKMLAKGETKRSIAREIEETVQGGYHYYRAADEQAFSNLHIAKGPADDEFFEAIDFLKGLNPDDRRFEKPLNNLVVSCETNDWESVINNGLMQAALTTKTYYRKELSPKLLERLAVLRQKCAAELLPVRRAQSEAAYQVLDKFNSEYMSLLRSGRMLAFADITYLLARWLNPSQSHSNNTVDSGSLAMISIDPQQLKLRMDCGIDHLLLDEFQDTAVDQWSIIEPLAQPLTENISPNQSFFCVGDTKQAIYGWRGGVAEIFDTVEQSIKNLCKEPLNESRRSSQQVMDAVNQVFLRLPLHSNFADCQNVAIKWSNDFPEHKTALKKLMGTY